MKDTTIQWIKKRLSECADYKKSMLEDDPTFAKTKKYYGIKQEENALGRILRMEDIESPHRPLNAQLNQ